MAARGEIGCGDTVKDSITGFEGVVVAITTWLNGCERVTIQPRKLFEGKPVESQTFDSEQLELKDKAAPKELAPTGGPHPEPSRAVAPR